jgi:hypothetical protein
MRHNTAKFPAELIRFYKQHPWPAKHSEKLLKSEQLEDAGRRADIHLWLDRALRPLLKFKEIFGEAPK